MSEDAARIHRLAISQSGKCNYFSHSASPHADADGIKLTAGPGFITIKPLAEVIRKANVTLSKRRKQPPVQSIKAMADARDSRS